MAADPDSSRWMAFILRPADVLHRASTLAAQTLLAALTLLVLAAVFWRYVLQDALVWTEEAARYIMIWTAFLGAAVAVREGGHIAIDTLLSQLPSRAARRLGTGIGLVSIAFLLITAWLGFSLTSKVLLQRSPTLDLSMAIPYLAIPIGTLLMAVQICAVLLRGEAVIRPGTTDSAI
jgi:TRAP-type C4-dicarboxylate transport system permease small subunit